MFKYLIVSIFLATLSASADGVGGQTDVRITESALAYGDKWREAYEHPGKMIPVETEVATIAVGFLTATTTTVTQVSVIYDDSTRVIDTQTKNLGDPVVSEDHRFRWLWLSAVVLMGVSHALMRMGYNNIVPAAFGGTATVLAAVFTGMFTGALVGIAAGLGFLAFLIALIAAGVTKDDLRTHTRITLIFFTVMCSSAVLLYV